PDGFMLGADESGKPSWLNIPAPTAEEITAIADARKAQLRADADAIIAPLQDAVSLNIATEEEAARYDSWRQYRVMLSRIDTSQALTIEWPERPA
ncbi:tail fiber assembly protein, partial [Peribacillus sp. SIMBA_075]